MLILINFKGKRRDPRSDVYCLLYIFRGFVSLNKHWCTGDYYVVILESLIGKRGFLFIS